MKEVARYIIPAGRKIQSLCWRGDELVDFVSGIVVYGLDGTSRTIPISDFGERFNRCISSPRGEYAVIYDVIGTNGFILKKGAILREIKRSDYHSDIYEYPVTLFDLPTGQTVIAHCPDEYCKLEIEDAETGQRLTSRTNKPMDFFQSCLQTTLDSKFLLSSGWVWQPFNDVVVFDLEQALARPESLDDRAISDNLWKSLKAAADDFDLWEIDNAAFNHSNQIVLVGGNGEAEIKQIISVYDLIENRVISVARLEEVAGKLMPMDEYAVGFCQHPKLIELKTGKIVQKWPEIFTGNQVSSFVQDANELPGIAMDAAMKRFAVADRDKITVIQLG